MGSVSFRSQEAAKTDAPQPLAPAPKRGVSPLLPLVLAMGSLSTLILGIGAITQRQKPVPEDAFVVSTNKWTGHKDIYVKGAYPEGPFFASHLYPINSQAPNVLCESFMTQDQKPLALKITYGYQLDPELTAEILDDVLQGSSMESLGIKSIPKFDSASYPETELTLHTTILAESLKHYLTRFIQSKQYQVITSAEIRKALLKGFAGQPAYQSLVNDLGIAIAFGTIEIDPKDQDIP